METDSDLSDIDFIDYNSLDFAVLTNPDKSGVDIEDEIEELSDLYIEEVEFPNSENEAKLDPFHIPLYVPLLSFLLASLSLIGGIIFLFQQNLHLHGITRYNPCSVITCRNIKVVDVTDTGFSVSFSIDHVDPLFLWILKGNATVEITGFDWENQKLSPDGEYKLNIKDNVFTVPVNCPTVLDSYRNSLFTLKIFSQYFTIIDRSNDDSVRYVYCDVPKSILKDALKLKKGKKAILKNSFLAIYERIKKGLSSVLTILH